MAAGSVGDWETVKTGGGRSSDWENVAQEEPQPQEDTSSFWTGVSKLIPDTETLKLLGRAALGDTSAHVQLGSALYHAHKDQVQKALADFGQGENVSGLGHAAAAILPMVGPAAAHAGETIGSGKIKEGLGEAVANVLPFAAGAIPGISEGATAVGDAAKTGLVKTALKTGLRTVPEDLKAGVVAKDLQLGAYASRSGRLTTMQDVKALKSQVDAKIANIESNQLGPGNTVSRDAVTANVDANLMPRLENATRSTDTATVQNLKDNFQADYPAQTPPSQAQRVKVNTDTSIGDKNFGQQKGPAVEFEKQIRFGLRKELENLDPTLKPLNADSQSSIILDNVLMKAAKTTMAWRSMLLRNSVAGVAGYAVGGPRTASELMILSEVLAKPQVQQAIAFAINKAQKLGLANVSKAGLTGELNQQSEQP